MSYVGVFLLGSITGALLMALVAGASMNNQCVDCRIINNTINDKGE